MHRCARSGYRPSPRLPGVGGSGAARPPPSRALPAGKSARSNTLHLILDISQDCRPTPDLLPSQANSTPLLRGAVLSSAGLGAAQSVRCGILATDIRTRVGRSCGPQEEVAQDVHRVGDVRPLAGVLDVRGLQAAGL